MKNKQKVADFNELEPDQPAHARVGTVDLVIIRWPDADEVSVLYGRCLHRGALLADGRIEGDNLICGLHDWDYRFRTGVSEFDHSEQLAKFEHVIEDGGVFVDADEVDAWAKEHPQPYDREAYQGAYADSSGSDVEDALPEIRSLATDGLSDELGHGPVESMGVPRGELPGWGSIQVLAAQFDRLPCLDDERVDTQVVLGPRAKKPLILDIPIFVSDMSFGALSPEAKVALARGAKRAGTAICSGEGGAIPEELDESDRYLFELGTGRHGFDLAQMSNVQAFHFKLGQGAKTGVGGHLPGAKVTKEIAEVRDIEAGEDSVSPARFPDLSTPAEFAAFADEVRDASGGIPIGFKLSAQHVEPDIDAAIEAGADYLILDGRGGGTGAAPRIIRDHFGVPTIPGLGRARRHLDRIGALDVTLVVTGGLREPADFFKALALGADAVAIANSAIQAIGCLAMRACHTGNCPVGIATQRESLRSRLDVEIAARRLERFLESSITLMSTMARACGHQTFSTLSPSDLSTFDYEFHLLTGVPFAGHAEGTTF